MSKNNNKLLALVLMACSLLASSFVFASTPVTTDNRIKTYVYNENEVFLVVVHYGYQSNIEFAKGEEIETISIGDSYAWKLTPSGRRLFIKPLESNIHTNMTIITNKRTYQFDVASKSPDLDDIDTQLSYVVRFYYPDSGRKIRKIGEKTLMEKVSEPSNYDYDTE